MRAAVLVAVGGALGSVARYWIGAWLAAHSGSGFPFATLAINVSGGLVIGGLAAVSVAGERLTTDSTLWLFGVVGICGGFTTFSAFSLQNLQLLQAGRWGAALIYMGASVGLCLAATALGMAIFTRA